MRKNYYVLIVIAIILSTIAIAKEPRNLDYIKSDLIKYHDSGEYIHDIDRVMKHALSYLQLRLDQEKNQTKKMAVVLDIDETALSNYPEMIKTSFGNPFIKDEGHDPAILPTLQLYQFAKNHHIAVIFLTGRQEAERKTTENNLLEAGYKDWDDLILRNKQFSHLPAAVYKTAMRKRIEQQGYDIILNIGDQKSDLAGGYADKTFKLANPYYYIS